MRAHSSRTTILLAFALTVGIAGCASAGGASRPAGATQDRIVRAELETLGQLDALQAVQRLRSQWLRTRGGVGGEPPVLYVDGTRRGSADELRFIRTDEVQSMEYMSSSDATTRFGTGHSGGAIMVTMIR
jgi:hypothetical protein